MTLYEEFKGTGNNEIRFQKPGHQTYLPAINIDMSGTRRMTFSPERLIDTGFCVVPSNMDEVAGMEFLMQTCKSKTNQSFLKP